MAYRDIWERRLYDRIRHGNNYWFARLILGWHQTAILETFRGVPRSAQRQYARGRERRRYAQLRAQGLTSAEAIGRIKGWKPAEVLKRARDRRRRWLAKWGGYGQGAWIRREQSKLAAKMGIEEDI